MTTTSPARHSSTRAFVPDRGIFENISQIVDDIFNDYIVRQGRVEPLFAQFCDGVRTKCGGLSQWGSVDLAEEGMTPYEILQYYYGGDIGLVTNAPSVETFRRTRGGRCGAGASARTCARSSASSTASGATTPPSRRSRA